MSTNIADVFIYDAVRTPTGAHGGGLSQIRPDDLAAGVIESLLKRNPNFDPARISEVILGNANGGGEGNRYVARMFFFQAEDGIRDNER